jgi:hypothetical protein
MAEAATQDRQQRRRQWARRLAVALGLVLVYVLAESALRHGVYGRPRIRSAAEWKPVVDRLPLLLREPIERRLKAAELESTLAMMNDPAKALPLLYKLAPLYGGRQRREVYQRIMNGYPGEAHAALAWASYIREYRPPKPVELYLGYATQVTTAPPAELIQVWAIGWGAVLDRPEREREAYLAALAERRLVASGLVGAYEEWVLSCMRRQRTTELATANELLEQCRELWLQETETLKR